MKLNLDVQRIYSISSRSIGIETSDGFSFILMRSGVLLTTDGKKVCQSTELVDFYNKQQRIFSVDGAIRQVYNQLPRQPLDTK
jgi:hypothetical protein